MDDRLLTILTARQYVTRPEVLACGYDDRDIKAARRAGLLDRIGPGLYADGRVSGQWTREHRHTVCARAVQNRLGESVVVSHQSALAVHGIAQWGLDLSSVHVTRRDDGRGRREAGVQHHRGGLVDDDVVEIDGMLVTTPARAVWETVCGTDTERGMVIADSALHLRLVDLDALLALSRTFAHWRGSRGARLTLALSDGGSESPGESRSRHLFWRHGVPRPDLQILVRDRDGMTVGRADFGWIEAGHLGEFDGRLKYVGAHTEADVEALVREKEREDRMRSLGWGMSRLVWADLDPRRAASTAARLNAEIEQSRHATTRGRTIIA